MEKIIPYNTIEILWSSHLINPRKEDLTKSIIWNDACELNDTKFGIMPDGYRYEIAFKGVVPVGVLTIWDESLERFCYKNGRLFGKFVKE